MNESEKSTFKIIILSLFMAVIGFYLDQYIFRTDIPVFCLTYFMFLIPTFCVVCTACFTYLENSRKNEASVVEVKKGEEKDE